MKAQKAKMKANEAQKPKMKGNEAPKGQNERKWSLKRPKWKEMNAQNAKMNESRKGQNEASKGQNERKWSSKRQKWKETKLKRLEGNPPKHDHLQDLGLGV